MIDGDGSLRELLINMGRDDVSKRVDARDPLDTCSICCGLLNLLETSVPVTPTHRIVPHLGNKSLYSVSHSILGFLCPSSIFCALGVILLTQC